MSQFFSNLTSSIRTIVLQPRTEKVSDDLAALNAAAPVKAAKNVDNLGFALFAMEKAGVITSDTVPEGARVSMGEAYQTLCMGLRQLQPGSCPVSVGEGVDESGIAAFDKLVAAAASNEKSELERITAAAVVRS